jgi:hypothetical protein
MKRRATVIGFFGFGLVLAFGLWLATEGRDPLLQFGFELRFSKWTISRNELKVGSFNDEGPRSWDVFAIGPIGIMVRNSRIDR